MADSSMTNISAVESYGKNLNNISQQMVQTFTQFKQQTALVSIGMINNIRNFDKILVRIS